jgi:diguanylate cyclase (GGDEF)-like protein
MTLHIPTLLLALVAGFLLLSLELGLAQRNLRARADLRLWALGSWSLVGGFAMLAARVVLPLPLSIVAGNALIALGICTFTSALWLRLRAKAMPRVTWALLVAAFVALPALMLDWPLARRTATLSFMYALVVMPGLWVVARDGWQAERSLRTVAITLALAMVALLLRAVHAATTPAEYTDLFQASLGQSLTFLMAFLALLGTGFGYVLSVLEQVSSRLEHLATHDGLTGCLNRSTTDELLAHALERGRREREPVSFVLLDIDHFKQVNDRYGHRAGDAVLRRVAEVVRTRLRASDVFGRTGGEEFGLVLPRTDPRGARQLTEELRLAVQALETALDDGQAVRVTLSAGVACARPGIPLPAERLYAMADDALYAAKDGGRNRVAVHPGTPEGTTA